MLCTFLWLVVWLCESTPPVANWNDWMTALVICVAVDVLGGSSIVSRR